MASSVMSVILFSHFKYKISSENLALYTIITLIVFHSIILGTVPHATYKNASLNMVLDLIFLTLVLRWPAKPAMICTALVFIFFPYALYSLNPEALPQFIREGGFFYFLGHLIFPFIMHVKYKNDKRSFYYQYRLSEQNEILEKQIRITEEATNAKTDFLSMMSHEIRTPLNGIVGIVHLLEKGHLEASFQEELIHTLLFSSNHLMTVVNDILDFNKINSNHVKLDSSSFDAALFFRNLEKTFIQKAKEKKLDLNFEIEDGLPSQLIGDQGRLNQIITNFIHNAIKFTDKGSVKLLVKETSRNEDEISLYFEISDTGIGIPQDQQPVIFELFTQVHTSNNRQYGGTGLGLAITKELLRLFESEITLESELGRGSAFSFTVKFKYSTQPQIVEKKDVMPISSYDQSNVLVVDDNSTNLLLATTFLKRRGIKFESAVNGQEAFEKFNSVHYDLILMDLRMPVMNGFECARLIREQGSKVPIIALTASAFENEKEKALANGFSGYLIKPFLPDDLFGIILPYLDNQQLEKNSSQ
ncbi:response regulator [Dyadobacter sp. 3J3]|uniref:response regulator n=1 Tax=Dyadobacter sp. 3J3 TaxID=2606600 RepID=UPI00135B630A|nr:response regulator [Dyadobacter sp. 3J3]